MPLEICWTVLWETHALGLLRSMAQARRTKVQWGTGNTIVNWYKWEMLLYHWMTHSLESLYSCWLRCSPLPFTDDRTASQELSAIKVRHCLHSWFVLSIVLEFILCFSLFLAICLCSMCVCGDSLGPSRMDPSSHPRVQTEIKSVVLEKMQKEFLMDVHYDDKNLFLE